jgi:hypothetical protein
MTDLPASPTSIAEVSIAQEIRAYLRSQKSPIDFVLKNISDPRILGAILHAPISLTSLSDAQLSMVRERARRSLHPEQTQMQEHLTKALDDLREGVAAARRAVLERCQMSGRMSNGPSEANVGPLLINSMMSDFC